jgi:hypothetical protein
MHKTNKETVSGLNMNQNEILTELEHLDSKHKVDILRYLKETEKQLLVNLYSHHRQTVEHVFHVCADCEYVASRLGMAKDAIERLKIAAVLHDVGKLDIELIVLDQGVDKAEQIKIMQFIGKLPGIDPLRQITLRDLIDYRSTLSIFSRKRISKQHRDELLNRLGNEANITLLNHIRNHQEYTRRRLIAAGTDLKIVGYASRHHPEYLAEKMQKLEVYILSVVDKFNAMVQSDAIRNYTEALGRAEALDVLVEKLKQPRIIVKVLAEKYVPIEEEEILKTKLEMSAEMEKNVIAKIIYLLRLDQILGGILRNRKEVEHIKEEVELKYGRAG